MRNLKKILALVLALMMVMSMMVTASATSFEDDASINAKYYEAVSVLSGLGVIRGVENADGSFNFNPDGKLTRAQAATIVAYILEGTLDTIADEVSIYENPFTDVPEWAVPYVLYAHSNGIIVGRTATTYDPNATITGYELGKMLLIAGAINNVNTSLPYTNDDFLLSVYVVDGKAYTTEAEALVASLNAGGVEITTKSIARSDWQVRVASGLKTAGIWDGEFQLSKKLSREEACFLAFNTLIASTLDDSVFALSKNTTSTDDFGRATVTYTATNVPTMNVVLATEVNPFKFVATAGTTTIADDATLLSNLNTALGLTGTAVLVDNHTDAGSIKMYVNGYQAYDNLKAGDSVELFIGEDNKLDKVVVIREEVLAATKGLKIEGGANDGKYNWSFGTYKTIAAEDAYKNGDNYVVIGKYVDGTDDIALSAVAPASTISNAKILKADNADPAVAKSITVGTDKLPVSGAMTEGVTAALAFGVAYDYILNSNGYVLYIDEAYIAPGETTNPDWGYAWLLAAESQITTSSTGSSLIGGSASYSWDIAAVAKLVIGSEITYADLSVEKTVNPANNQVTGVKVSGVALESVANEAAPDDLLTAVDVDTDTDGEGEDVDTDLTDGDDAILAAGWVKYVINEDGTYTLANIASVTGYDSGLTLSKTNPVFETSKYVTSDTVWNKYEYNEDDAKIIVTPKTGYTNFTNGDVAGFYTANTDNIVTEIVSFVAAPLHNDTSTDVNYAYYAGYGEYDGVVGSYAHKFYINGEAVEYFTTNVVTVVGEGEADDNKLETGKVYALTIDNATGKVNAAEYVAYDGSGEVTLIDSKYVVVGGTPENVKNLKVYNVSTGHTGEVDTLSTKLTSTGAGDTISFIYNDSNQIVVAYITGNAR